MGPGTSPPTPDDVIAAAFEEFAVLIDEDEARTALHEAEPAPPNG
ncbi:hypothetical protein GCM10009801_10730 [Streptomyces albiaxialis]|uniref:Uncharacterized protein n=1 Tax=Streptomyces albiaxialis TaxID=329523 RepID=A0ABN2VM38_9ACTN